jgi:hypothetical protein
MTKQSRIIPLKKRTSCLVWVSPTALPGAHCKSLIAIDLSTGLGSLRSVESLWLYGCTSLVTADFSGLISLVSAGNSWMSGCKSLVAVEFSARDSEL